MRDTVWAVTQLPASSDPPWRAVPRGSFTRARVDFSEGEAPILGNTGAEAEGLPMRGFLLLGEVCSNILCAQQFRKKRF